MTAYEIVRAPDLEVLSMLVESYIEQGYSPAGGIVIDHTTVGKVYIQAVFKLPQSDLPEDTTSWRKEVF